VLDGRAKAMSADSPVTAYAMKVSDGRLVEAGPMFDAAPWGLVVAKDSTLVTALQQALQRLIASGRYTAILDRWGVDVGAITDPTINAAVY
jgi:polar amino acid transport system substrate-binding protein